MSFGEMTIILDGVTTLLHIPSCDRLFSVPINININSVVIVVCVLLGAIMEELAT